MRHSKVFVYAIVPTIRVERLLAVAVENVRREGRGSLTGLLTIIAMIKMRPLAKKQKKKARKKKTLHTHGCLAAKVERAFFPRTEKC